MENRDGFTIIIPAYNEESCILSAIEKINKLAGNHEIIVVDDGSTDRTGELVRKTNVRTFVIITLSGVQLLAIGMLADLIDKRN